MFNKPKKLKKIPSDLVSYIQIETEAIRDANDKMMISSYCLSKLEMVNWYLELLEVGSKKYIVPQSKAHLEMVRDQLMACHKAIMAVKITNPNDRPLLDIKYPKGYEG
jgi:hypothetical protein